MTKFSNFSDLGQHLVSDRAERAAMSDEIGHRYEAGFIEPSEMAKMSIVDAPEALDMPNPEQVGAAIELAVGTIFDVLRDTRMEEFAGQIAWGMVNSFHMVAKQVERREDDAADKLRELARTFDPSEIYAVELEDTQTLCQTLQGCREAMETMRDHASEVYRVETGRPFSSARGSTVSKGFTASQISARDYLAARARERREQFAPEGPLVAVSGGQEWHDHEALWDRLDGIKARVPEMVLITTAQRKGVDAIATAWAAARGVKTVQFVPDRSLGNRAAFVRNDKMVNLKPVEAIVCEGSGIQANLAQKLRQNGVPLHIFRLTDQCPMVRVANRG
jgi:hypothetical protein